MVVGCLLVKIIKTIFNYDNICCSGFIRDNAVTEKLQLLTGPPTSYPELPYCVLRATQPLTLSSA